MIKTDFTTNEYYKNRLSLFLSQNPYVVKQTELLANLIATCDDVIETVFKVLNIYNISDLAFTNGYLNGENFGYDPKSTKFQPLDMIASIVGVNRELKLDYDIDILKEKPSNSSESQYSVKLINIYDKVNETEYNKELKKVNSRAYIGEGLVFTTSADTDTGANKVPIAQIESYTGDVTLDGDVYYRPQNSNFLYKALSSTKITGCTYYKIRPYIAGGTPIYFYSGNFVSNIDTRPVKGNTYWIKESYIGEGIGLVTARRNIKESSILTNEDLISLIKIQIVKNHFEGTNGELIKLYETIGLNIHTMTNNTYSVTSYLEDAENNVTPIFKKMFLYTDLFANSLGIYMNKVLVSSMGGFFRFKPKTKPDDMKEEEFEDWSYDLLDYNLLL